MPSHTRPRHSRLVPALCATVALVAIAVAPADAEDPSSHVRPMTAHASALVANAAARSPVIRDMVDRLEQSGVIVYIRHRVFRDTQINGRTGILGAAGGQRYLVIELACVRIESEEMATLGHELHHALEIAGEPSIVDSPSLGAHYARIGLRARGDFEGQTYETTAARQTERQVRREIAMIR